MDLQKKTSTIVCNHVSWVDAVLLIKTIRPAFAPSAGFQNVPLFSTLINVLDSIYMPQGGSEDNRIKILQKIKDRQELIENTGAYAPFLIFPEGTTSNGTCLLKFRKGAFYSEKKVRPIFMKF